MGRKHEVNNLDLWLSRYTHPGAQLAFEDGCCGRGLECTVGLLICIKILISSNNINKDTVHSRPLLQQSSSNAHCAPGSV